MGRAYLGGMSQLSRNQQPIQFGGATEAINLDVPIRSSRLATAAEAASNQKTVTATVLAGEVSFQLEMHSIGELSGIVQCSDAVPAEQKVNVMLDRADQSRIERIAAETGFSPAECIAQILDWGGER